ncbi:acyltransferase [Flexibacter flexilis]|nr:acyltransferase [Flexibacter flexilis]
MATLLKANRKTIYFNFKYLPFRQALRLPINVSSQVHLARMGGQIQFDCPIHTGMIQLGHGYVGIFDKQKSRSIWEVTGTVIFGGTANIGHGSKICVMNGTLRLGKNFTITAESSIVTACEIHFGDDCLLSWDVLVMDTDFHHIKNQSGAIINAPSPIRIGNKVWIGCRCLILKGAAIADNTVIGANSLVSRKLPKENAIYGGQPAQLLKEEISWDY